MSRFDDRALNVIGSLSSLLRSSGIPDASKEAETILCHVLGLSKAQIYCDNPDLTPREAKEVLQIADLRSRGKPLQYLLGTVDFYGLEIKVGKGVLIPRPETEILVGEVLSVIKGEGIGSPDILDIGTGSGCIAVAIGKHFKEANITAVDISEEALCYARENAEQYHLQHIEFLKGSLFEPLKGRVFDIIVSNPPYITSSDLPGLQREIYEHEPTEALDGGTDGLDIYRNILKDAYIYLKTEGRIFLEIGMGQAPDIIEIGKRHGLSHIKAVKDLAGIERVIVFKKAPSSSARDSG